jgi:hypothetical protein
MSAPEPSHASESATPVVPGDPLTDPAAREAILREVLANSRISMWGIRADGTLLFWYGASAPTTWKP